MLPRSSRPRAAWGTGVYPSKQYFDIKMRCLRQRRHRRRWYLKGADNTPYEKIGDEVRSLADEVPFEIPDSWEWVRLIDVCEYIQRGKSPKYSPIKKYPVVAQKCNQWSGFSIEKAQFIEPNSLSSYGPERLLQDNDLMWNSTGLGTLGRMAIYKTAANPYELAVADSHVTVIRPLKQFVLPEYLYYYFANPSVQSVIEDQADGTTKQKELATATIKAYLTPIPPLDEQRRILAKLSEVLPVVKNYGVVYDETTAMQEAFPESLKKSILQEAVQGKLVPQDPSDEPAEALLERIRAEKQRLIKEGKIKKDKHESVIFRRDNSHYYGLRRSEVLGLRWSAIDMEHKTISISHKVIEAEVDGKFVPMGEDVLKTKSSFRTLPLIPAVGIILLEEKEKQEMYRRLFKKSYCRDYLDYICVDQCGKLLRPNYVTEHFSWLIEKYGLRKVRFHDLRHTCASLLLSNGISMKQIQIWLGHSTFSTTADIYAHLDYSAQEASANAMNGMFNRPEKEEQLA